MTRAGEQTGDRTSPSPPVERLREDIGAILEERFQIAGIDDESDLFELGLDSMARLELLALLEQSFEVELTEDITTEFQTLSRIARVIQSARGSHETGSRS